MPRLYLPSIAATVVALTGTFARADDVKRYALDPTYRKECGECHVAYPPTLMQAGQWRQVMRQLDRHYGVDAALDDKTTASLTAWLERNAGASAKRTAAGDPPRITEGAWFRKEHDEVPASALRNAGNLSRCDACHRGAANGEYGEHEIRLPTKPLGGQS